MIVWALLLLSAVGPGAAVVHVTATEKECQVLLDTLVQKLSPRELAQYGARCERTTLSTVKVD